MSTYELPWWRARLVMCCWIAVVVLGCCASAQDATAPLEVDEQLFLLRVLEDACESWPSDEGDPQIYADALRDYRNDLLHLRTYIQQQPELDQRLAERFDALVGLIDAHRQLLAQVTGINIDKDAVALQDNLASGFKAVATGVAVGEPVSGSIVAGGSYLLDSLQRSKKRDHATQVRMEAAIQVYQDQVAVFLHACKLLAQDMTRQHGWGRGEAGWTDNDARDELVARWIAEDNLNGLIQIFDEEAKRRPRDPFAADDLYSLVVLANPESAETYLECAIKLDEAASLVPDGAVYDDIRLRLLVNAMESAMNARSYEYTDHMSLDSSSPASRLFVDLSKRTIPLAQEDPTGLLRVYLTCALLYDGQLDAADKQSMAIAALQQHDPLWQLLRAAIDSRRHRFDEALDGVKNAINSGTVDPTHVWTEPHFRPLINARSGALHEILDPKWIWHVSNDLIWDDVTLTNGSFFPLTNVVLTVNLRQDFTTVPLELKADILTPGQTHTWKDVVDGPRGEWDASSNATLICDQFYIQP